MARRKETKAGLRRRIAELEETLNRAREFAALPMRTVRWEMVVRDETGFIPVAQYGHGMFMRQNEIGLLNDVRYFIPE